MKDKAQKQYNRRLLWRFTRGSRLAFLLCMAAGALSSLADMLSPQIIRTAVDNVLGGSDAPISPLLRPLIEALGGAEYLAGHIGLLALALLGVAFVKVLALYGFRVLNTSAAERLTKTMRDTLFLHI